MPLEADPAVPTDAPERPSLGAVVKHLTLAILTANIIPGLLFYSCMLASNIWLALTVALCWCYGAAAWRSVTKRRASILLYLTIIGLTGKTIFAFATGSTYFYFLQPALSDVVVATLFLGSLLTARPVVARLANDFYPMDDDLHGRARVQRLFWRLTLLWAVIVGIKATLSLYLLHTQPTDDYVAMKTVFAPALIAGGAAVTVWLSAKVARHEGLLGGSLRTA
ncbi:VC0807 family protein [Sporichthya polymorpha]|uniref:VC0807 family protein n=1 Tax=Sporichthya polymorpha TaxID=35751 RepID=UPI00035E18CD|nr:VC0807 family protein [Sporichthya polymorpha]